MSVDSKDPSSEEVKIEDESNAPVESEVKNASKAKSNGKKISIKKISPAEIARNNGLKMNSPLTIGKELNIGNKNIYRTINSKKRTILYSVKQGDSLYRIADIFNIEISDIRNINELSSNEIKPGQVLKIIIRAY